MIPEDILEKQDLPKFVIISVSVVGVILLLINVGLVAGCMLKKRAKRVKGKFWSTSKSLNHLVFNLRVNSSFICFISRTRWTKQQICNNRNVRSEQLQ